MTGDHLREQSPEGPPEAFVKQVKDALEHLYDFPYLQRHPLARAEWALGEQPAETASQRLRRDLVTAIETLNPGAAVPFRAPHARLYNLLHLHYVEGMTIQEVAHDLGLSVRQAYRDMRRGEENVAAVLWARRPGSLAQESTAVQASSVQAEMARLETYPRPTDLRRLVQHAHDAVERMAAQRHVGLHIEVTREPVTVSADPAMARQVLVHLLSQAIQQALPGALHLALAMAAGAGSEREQAFLTLCYRPKSEAADTSVVNPLVTQLVDRLGWTVEQEDGPGGERAVTLHVAAHGPAVLVIDDNEGLVELLERYLTRMYPSAMYSSAQSCRVVAAAGGLDGLRLAQELRPDAIVLDVMMPDMDGWELLQRLRTHPETSAIPVIICSVFHDPELAFSLGASLFLPKPVSRDDILSALRQLGVM